MLLVVVKRRFSDDNCYSVILYTIIKGPVYYTCTWKYCVRFIQSLIQGSSKCFFFFFLISVTLFRIKRIYNIQYLQHYIRDMMSDISSEYEMTTSILVIINYMYVYIRI